MFLVLVMLFFWKGNITAYRSMFVYAILQCYANVLCVHRMSNLDDFSSYIQ